MTGKLNILATATAFVALITASAALAEDGTWTADLAPLNSAVTGTEAGGTATLTIDGDTLNIKIDATGTAPDIMHLQHIHGFAEGDEKSTCPGQTADTNGDGVVDLMETEPDAGVTMVPFHGDPASMEIVADSYPTADADGAYSYEQSVSLSTLETAFEKAFPDQKLDFDRRVIFLHGVPEGTELPDTVQSLGDVPAHVTLPIACGEIQSSKG